VHGVTLPATEPHPAPRAVVQTCEPAHAAELPRRAGCARRRRGGEVGGNPRRYAVQRRVVERGGERPRAALGLFRPPGGTNPAFAFLALQGFAHAFFVGDEKEVKERSGFGRECKESGLPEWGAKPARVSQRVNSGRDSSSRPVPYLRLPRSRTRCHHRPHPPRQPRCRSQARPDEQRPPT
jgi:hypothetical protein